MFKKAFFATAFAGIAAGCAGTPDLPVADVPVSAYRCADGTRFTATFDDGEAVVLIEGGETLTLRQRRSGSGFRYASRRVEFQGKGSEATFTNDRRPQTICRAS